MPELAVIFTFIIVVIIIGTLHDERVKKMKIEAALRQQEMERGYAPGTYSKTYYSKKSDRAQRKEDFRSEQKERADLEKGIEDLEKRIENINLIMKEKNKKGAHGND